ncbi:MAG: ribosome-associated translation inhibitor RaiA [Candidatus Nealsonbacteria bacterium]
MKVIIKETNLRLTPENKKVIEDKIAPMDKFIPNLNETVEAFIEVALETHHHKKGSIYYAEANINVPGTIIRAEARAENIYKAVNEVKDELQVLLKKYKARIVKH